MRPSGKRNNALAICSITTYLSHIDKWYATTSNQSVLEGSSKEKGETIGRYSEKEKKTF